MFELCQRPSLSRREVLVKLSSWTRKSSRGALLQCPGAFRSCSNSGPACACRGAPGHAGRGCRADVGCEHAPLPQAFVSRSQDMPRNKIIMSGLRRRSSDGKRQRRWDITYRSYWRPPLLFDRSSTGWTNYDPKICQKVIGQVML